MKKPPSHIKTKLQKTDSEIQKLVLDLYAENDKLRAENKKFISENKKLQKAVVDVQFKNKTQKFRIDALEKKLDKESKKEHVQITMEKM
jgi:hypothetical protein